MHRFWASWPVQELQLPADAQANPINPMICDTADRGKYYIANVEEHALPAFHGRRWKIGFTTSQTQDQVFAEVERQLKPSGYLRAQSLPYSTLNGITNAWRIYWSADQTISVRVDYCSDPKGLMSSPPYEGWEFSAVKYEKPVPQFGKREVLR